MDRPNQKKYSSIFSDNPDKDLLRCTCPLEYVSYPQSQKVDPKIECCQFGRDCQFVSVPMANLSDEAKCTCIPSMCICSPEAEVTLIPDCDPVKCICGQSDTTDLRLLPTDFRNALKREQIITDERMKKVSGEIKQLLIEHEDGKKKIPDESIDTATEKSNKKQVTQKVSIQEHVQATPSENKEDKKDAPAPKEEIRSPMLSIKSTQKKPKVSLTSTRMKKNNYKRERQLRQQVKSEATQSKSATMSQTTQYSCGCRMPKKKPLHVKYYFSGGTENYGVRLGHKHCMPSLGLVPKNMGWLWNIQDTSKGMRERKGGPPGFIGKNIKNMIKVLKQFDDVVEPIRVGLGTPKREKVILKKEESKEEPPLLHIQKRGRTYNITFCPKSSDTDIGPIPIPFTITEKQRDSDSSSSDSTLEFEFHSPKPKLPQKQIGLAQDQEQNEIVLEEPKPSAPSSNISKSNKKKSNKKTSPKSTEENKVLWEDQRTQIENIA